MREIGGERERESKGGFYYGRNKRIREGWRERVCVCVREASVTVVTRE